MRVRRAQEGKDCEEPTTQAFKGQVKMSRVSNEFHMGVSDCDVLCKRNWKNIGRAYFLILTISHLSDVGLSLAGPISDENCMGNLRNSFKLTEATTPSLPNSTQNS